MPVSKDTIAAHAAKWEPLLGRGAYPYRANWPSRLFRHEPIENAAAIIRSGSLLSRNVAMERGVVIHDIAPENIIGNTDQAYSFARMYFRPRNPTQYHMEGIKKLHEIYQGKHAPVLVVFIFQMSSVLSLGGVRFSDGNMQRTGGDTRVWEGDEDFKKLPFEKIYHEGPFAESERDSIIRSRCAEVLVPHHLPLTGNLQGILCRSPAERAYLLYLLGDTADFWKDKIRVFSKPGIFQGSYAYLETVQCTQDKISFSFHPRRDGATVATEILVQGLDGRLLTRSGPSDLDTSKNWFIEARSGGQPYIVTFKIEGCMAYKAVGSTDNLPF